jgi:hypothetical protein
VGLLAIVHPATVKKESKMDDQNTGQAAGGLVTQVIGWFAHPFKTQGSALNWVLFVGLLVIAAWFWNHVLLTITDDV